MAHKAEITLPGYKLLEQQRVGRKGGGIALLLNETIDTRKVDSGERRSFEFCEWILKYGSGKLRVIVIYRPPYSAAHPVTSGVFLDEFSVYLESVVMSPEPLLITGDLNIHVNVSRDPHASRFLELLTSMGLEQHVDKPTHISGHTLDLIITRCSDSLLCAKPITDYLISDHVTVLCDLQLGKPPPKVKQVSYRKIKGIDRKKLEAELSSSQLCQNTPDTLDELVNSYNTTLAQVLDRQAPLCTKVIRSRPLVPWFNEEIKVARREKRKAERKWRRTGTREDMLAYKAKKNSVNALMNETRCKFYNDFVQDNSTNQRSIFSAVKKLLNQKNNMAVYPPVNNNVKLANQLGTFFVQKIETIGSKLDNMAQGLPSPPNDYAVTIS
ncbi:uncharacterized protein [Montipora capricornis]|uniref:uncharacterized protein n=1 Tax=Montipora capricornis TaxID=246305 RepID=UPI0035F190AD